MNRCAERLVRAGATLGWTINDVGPGTLERNADLAHPHRQRGDSALGKQLQHRLQASSINLQEGNGNIHRNYNGWIQNLVHGIKRAARSLLTWRLRAERVRGASAARLSELALPPDAGAALAGRIFRPHVACRSNAADRAHRADREAFPVRAVVSLHPEPHPPVVSLLRRCSDHGRARRFGPTSMEESAGTRVIGALFVGEHWIRRWIFLTNGFLGVVQQNT